MSFARTNIAATTAAVTNRIVASANMKVGGYTVANASPVWAGGALITVTHTQVGGVTDTLGTLVVVGTDLFGKACTETLTPSSATTVTGVGWVINTGNDTIVVGVAAGSYVATGGGQLRSLVVNTTANATVVLSDSAGVIATLKASIGEGTYYYDVPWSGFLKVATTSTNDVTAIHSPGVPTTYAMA